MKISENGLNLIKRFEGCRLSAYKAVESEKYYTIGYGHYGSDVKKGQTITIEQALNLLKKDVEKFEKKVNKYDSVYKFNQNQFDALVSFCYNIGNIDGITNKGTNSLNTISNSFVLYNKSGGVVLNGLVRRRKEEKTLFDTPVEGVSNNNYYPTYTGSSKSIVDALKELKIDSYYTYRKKIAEANGFPNYMGLGSQNNTLLDLLKRGKLKKFD